MSSITRREITTRRIEHVIPTGPHGACWNEVSLAIHNATEELRAAGHLGVGQVPSDDTIRVTGDDEAIIVFYEVRVP